MPFGQQATCPRCGKEAHGKKEIKEFLGYRNMGDGKIIPQSHCRECREEELKESRQDRQ